MAIESYTCFAIAAPGLEPLVARELAALGEQPRTEAGGVIWEGDARSMMRANLWLRTASRILVRVARFRATAFYELEKRAKRLPWEVFIAPGTDVEFRVTAHKSKLYHSDAIAERLRNSVRLPHKTRGDARERTGARRQLFGVRVFKDEFTISADTSGALLHMRGYRQEVGKAPLRETLAAALLMAADWDGSTSLLDPFCGSGTIPIEAALLARKIPPGIGRDFAFMAWPGHVESIWRDLIEDARAGTLSTCAVSIAGSDRDAGAIRASRANAGRAGVSDHVSWSTRALSAVEPPAATGLIACNPPYGVRISRNTDVRDLYAQLGKILRQRFCGWRLALYSPDQRLLHHLRLPLSEVVRTSNGGIRVSAQVGWIENGSP